MKQNPFPFCTASGGTGEWWDSALSKRGKGLQGQTELCACKCLSNPTLFTDLDVQRQLLPLCASDMCGSALGACKLEYPRLDHIICPVLPCSFPAPRPCLLSKAAVEAYQHPRHAVLPWHSVHSRGTLLSLPSHHSSRTW